MYLKILIPASIAGASSSWLESWVMRGLAEIWGDLDGIIDIELTGHDSNELHWPMHWYGLAFFRLFFSNGSSIPNAIESQIGHISPNGLSIIAYSHQAPAVKNLRLELEVPIPLEQAGKTWNRIIQGIPIGCTLTKGESLFRFQVPPRLHGKKSLISLDLSFVNEATTRCSILAGLRFDTKALLSKLMPSQAKSFLPIEIREIITV